MGLAGPSHWSHHVYHIRLHIPPTSMHPEPRRTPSLAAPVLLGVTATSYGGFGVPSMHGVKEFRHPFLLFSSCFPTASGYFPSRTLLLLIIFGIVVLTRRRGDRRWVLGDFPPDNHADNPL